MCSAHVRVLDTQQCGVSSLILLMQFGGYCPRSADFLCSGSIRLSAYRSDSYWTVPNYISGVPTFAFLVLTQHVRSKLYNLCFGNYESSVNSLL